MCRGNYTLIFAYDRCYYCGLSPVSFNNSRISGKTPESAFGFKGMSFLVIVINFREFFPQSGEAEIMRSVLYISAGLKHMMVTTDDGSMPYYLLKYRLILQDCIAMVRVRMVSQATLLLWWERSKSRLGITSFA